MRIIGGDWRGRVLSVPKGLRVRPTASAVREAVFSIIASLHPSMPRDMRVLDIFAGSGAFGFESLSRGCCDVCFIDGGRAAQACLLDNAARLDVMDRVTIYRRDATRLRARSMAGGDGYMLVFIDPPYGKGLVVPTLNALACGNWLVVSALLVIEEAVDAIWEIPAHYICRHRRDYGATQITILEYHPD